jgi:lysophospholipase L1-like esterase
MTAPSILEKIKTKLLLNQKYTVVFFGDSTISTEWVHPNVRGIIEYVLKMTLEEDMNDWRSPNWNLRFINAGLSGGSTKDFLHYMVDEVKDYKPDLVILVGGDNDLADDEIYKEQHAENMNEILTFLTNKTEDVVYCSAPYLIKSPDNNTRYVKFLELVKSLDILNKTIFINLFEYFETLDSERFFTFKISPSDSISMNLPVDSIDPFHPNQLGQAYLAKKLLKDMFDLEFDPEKFIETTNRGFKYPEF